MKFLPGVLLVFVLLIVFSSCARRRGMDVGMNHRRAPDWHRGGHYGHGSGYYHAPTTYRHWR